MPGCLSGLVAAGCCIVSFAAADDTLRDSIGDRPLAAHWIYDDLPRGEALARTTGKPLLVLFRCVPCQCAQTIDADLTDAQHPINELLEKYVCVRIVHFAGIDLARFQFDYDVSLVAVLMNADGTIYGRYGTRAVRLRTESTHVSTASLTKALERGLAIHSRHPLNKAELAGKQPREVPLNRPEDVPELAAVAARPVTRGNCLHCHMAGEALVRHAAERGQLSVQQLYPYPLPDNLGTVLDKDDGLVVKTVRQGSPAERAGLAVGDELRQMNGQPLISQADIQWVLHHLPVESEVTVRYVRGGQTLETKIALTGDWRKTDTTWRPTLNPIRNGLHIAPLSQGERKQYGLAADEPGFMIRYAFRTAGNAGLRAGDVILRVDGRPAPRTESELLAYCRLEDSSRKSILLDVLNKRGERREVTLPLVIELVPE